jgi:hypothetical protein
MARAIPPHAGFRRQWIDCGKPKCRKLHGPYWYAFWKDGRKERSAYVGSEAKLRALVASLSLTPRAIELAVSKAPPSRPHARQAALFRAPSHKPARKRAPSRP